MTPYEAYSECYRKGKRISELEGIISSNPEYSYRYALNIISGPFERGEEVISKDPDWSYEYICDIIEEPFEKCHPYIFNSEYKENYINFLKSIDYDITKISEWLI